MKSDKNLVNFPAIYGFGVVGYKIFLLFGKGVGEVILWPPPERHVPELVELIM